MYFSDKFLILAMKHIFFFIFFFLFYFSKAQANKWSGIMIDYTHQFPIGILADRFGDNSSIGITYIREKENNFFYGIDFDYMFGNKVQEDSLFSGITTANGEIIDGSGNFANLLIYERGISSHLFVGQSIDLEPTKKHSIYFSLGLGYLQHKIFIDKNKAYLPQLNGEYEYGYDRFTSGISTKLAADYMYFEQKNDF